MAKLITATVALTDVADELDVLFGTSRASVYSRYRDVQFRNTGEDTVYIYLTEVGYDAGDTGNRISIPAGGMEFFEELDALTTFVRGTSESSIVEFIGTAS